jgi:hypothetical protein
MNKKHLLVFTLAAVVASSLALAQNDNNKAPHRNIDANGDGVISKEEAAAFPQLAARFDTLDKNSDGKLTSDEWPMRRAGMRGQGQHRAPSAEMQARMAERRAACFDKADTDKNGQLSRAEFDKMHDVCRPAAGQGMRMQKRHGMRGAPHAPEVAKKPSGG